MSLLDVKKMRKVRRTRRVRAGHASRGSKLRITVFRSLSHIYAQVIDDAAGVTLASCSSLDLKNAKGKAAEVAHKVGLELAKKVSSTGRNDLFFDRGSYLYHGRVKALAEGLREGGLKF